VSSPFARRDQPSGFLRTRNFLPDEDLGAQWSRLIDRPEASGQPTLWAKFARQPLRWNLLGSANDLIMRQTISITIMIIVNNQTKFD